MDAAQLASVIERLTKAKAKVALTAHNDPMPSARLMAAVILLAQVIAELSGDTYAGPPTPEE